MEALCVEKLTPVRRQVPFVRIEADLASIHSSLLQDVRPLLLGAYTFF
jgi:hypothetical protein